MRLVNNRKATENWVMDTMPYFILFVIVLGISVVIFLTILSYFASKNIEIPKGVEEYILIERFYNSPDCFAYRDETGRVYQKVIDLEKFKSGSMDKCFLSSNNRYSFKLELENPENSNRITVNTNNWAENSNFRLQQKDVFVYFNNKIKNSKLSIYIQNA